VWHRLARSRWGLCYELPCEDDVRTLRAVSAATLRTHTPGSSTRRRFRGLSATAFEPEYVGFSEPDLHAALRDQPETPPSQAADPVFEAHMSVDMWLVCHE
jgi:hypothetical protein